MKIKGLHVLSTVQNIFEVVHMLLKNSASNEIYDNYVTEIDSSLVILNMNIYSL